MSSVVFILIDGLRPDAISPDVTPYILENFSQGAMTLHASSVMPTYTLPCHLSVFHSVDPSVHGVKNNTWKPFPKNVLGLIDAAALEGLRCAFIYNWEKLRNISKPGSLYYSYFRDNVEERSGDEVIAREAYNFILEERPDFAFVYLGTVDIVGEEFGWMTAEYIKQVSYVDRLVGELLEKIPQDYTVVLQSDHGGHDFDHGTDCPEDMTIPWMAKGKNIKKSYRIQNEVSLLDTAPTLARILSIQAPVEWQGRCLDEIFS